MESAFIATAESICGYLIQVSATSGSFKICPTITISLPQAFPRPPAMRSPIAPQPRSLTSLPRSSSTTVAPPSCQCPPRSSPSTPSLTSGGLILSIYPICLFFPPSVIPIRAMFAMTLWLGKRRWGCSARSLSVIFFALAGCQSYPTPQSDDGCSMCSGWVERNNNTTRLFLFYPLSFFLHFIGNVDTCCRPTLLPMRWIN
jgi:hypothetical protein